MWKPPSDRRISTPHSRRRRRFEMRILKKTLLLLFGSSLTLCLLVLPFVTCMSEKKSPFNDAKITDPTTNTGRPLSKAEFERARRTPPRLPDPSHPKHRAPPIDRPPYWNRNYLSYTFLRWPNRRVPYTIDSGFNDAQRTVIAQAIQHIEDAACVRFYPKTGQDQDFLHIYGDDKESCWADDHYERKKGQHSVHLHREYCVYTNVVAHEILHLLGVGHEQQRPDRDKFIRVNWTNIHVDHAFNFFKDTWDSGQIPSRPGSNCLNWRELATKSGHDPSHFKNCSSGLVRKDYGVGYDYYSIMHYQSNFFALDPNYSTLLPLDPLARGKELGGQEMTEKDVQKLRAAYQCDGREYSGCGGSLEGDGGDIELSEVDSEGCEWLVTVEDGYRVMFEIREFKLDCSAGNMTVFASFKQLNDVKGTFCDDPYGGGGGKRPPATITLPANSGTLEIVKRKGAEVSFRARWRKIKVSCCRSIRLYVAPSSPAFPTMRPFLGHYKQAGFKNGAPYYRLRGNYNVWLARTVPISSFSTAAWAVGHDLSGGPGQVGPEEPKFFLAGNCKCPRLLRGAFYRPNKMGPFLSEKDVSVSCS